MRIISQYLWIDTELDPNLYSDDVLDAAKRAAHVVEEDYPDTLHVSILIDPETSLNEAMKRVREVYGALTPCNP